MATPRAVSVTGLPKETRKDRVQDCRMSFARSSRFMPPSDRNACRKLQATIQTESLPDITSTAQAASAVLTGENTSGLSY